MWACSDGVCSWCRTRSSCGVDVQPVWQCFSPGAAAPCNTLVYQGLALAVAAALLLSVFPAFARLETVRRTKVPSHIFSLWMGVGIVLFSAPIANGTHLRCVNRASAASGLMLVVSLAAGVESLHALGLLQATGIMCGAAALAAFSLGSAVQPGLVSSWPVAAAGAACLLVGMLLVAWAGSIAAQATLPSTATTGQPTQQHPFSHGASLTLQQPLLQAAEQAPGTPAPSTSVDQQQQQHLTGRNPRYTRLAGWASAGVAGAMWAGVVFLVPLELMGRQCWGWPYLAGLSAGVLPAAPLLAYCLHWAHTGKVSWSLPLQPAAAALPGIAAGTLFASAAACCLLAAAVLGLPSAFLIMQCGLLVAGVGPVLCCREASSLRPCLVWCGGGCALLAGLFLLARASGPV